jgi:hypothetical protein
MIEKFVMNEHWDYLIILDACRYDYFKKYYRKYLTGGILEKAISSATWTLEWAEKNFKSYYDDVIYISSVPFINSIKEVSWHGNKFNAKKHFFRVVNGWDIAWDESLCAISPGNITNLAIEEFKKYPEKRIIIHYCQPHTPYLNYQSLNLKRKKKKKRAFRKDTLREKIKIRIAYLLILIGGTEFIWKLNKKFNFMKIRYLEYIWREKGKEGIVKGYCHNLEVVFNEIKNMYTKLPGNVIITSDHGEMLGEKKYYGHGKPIPRMKELIEVPWYIIQNNIKKIGKTDEVKKINSSIKKLRINNRNIN